jgi:hypothetical protein
MLKILSLLMLSAKVFSRKQVIEIYPENGQIVHDALNAYVTAPSSVVVDPLYSY